MPVKDHTGQRMLVRDHTGAYCAVYQCVAGSWALIDDAVYLDPAPGPITYSDVGTATYTLTSNRPTTWFFSFAVGAASANIGNGATATSVTFTIQTINTGEGQVQNDDVITVQAGINQVGGTYNGTQWTINISAVP
jgi:hypothetical protein